MKLAIGNDYSAIGLKNSIRAYLQEKGIDVVDVGTNNTEDARFHYPISGYKAARMVADGAADGAVLICGTGMGMVITANKVRGVRACVCSEPFSAHMAKAHNNANVLAFGARVVGEGMAKMIVDAWLEAAFEGERHQERVDMIMEIDKTGVLAEIL